MSKLWRVPRRVRSRRLVTGSELSLMWTAVGVTNGWAESGVSCGCRGGRPVIDSKGDVPVDECTELL